MPSERSDCNLTTMTQYDPIAVEIHRKALENIVNEMGLTLARTSGSPVVTDGKDFSTCLLDPDGEQLSLVAYVLIHAASSVIGVRTLIEQLAAEGDEPRPGDGWIVNDPHHGGAVHQGDVGIIMPTFYRGQHVGWGFANVHVLDIGGAAVSGFNPTARTVYEEGLRFPVVRVIRNGRLEEDWERYLEANVRVPSAVLNDIRSMIAANVVAERKLADVLDRFGLERHNHYAAISKQLSEDLLRRRIEGMPDGVYESVSWAEFDGHGVDTLIELGCRLEIDGSDLNFSFWGDPQVDSYMNSATGGMYGCLMTSLLTSLGYGDLPFNAGIWRPLTIDLGPPGTVVNSVPPAPVSATHAEVGMIALKLVKDVLSQALALSSDPVLRSRAAGHACDGAGTIGIAGRNQHGTTSVVYYLDTVVAEGGGAQTTGDGLDCYGASMMSGCGMADVERHESSDPVVFLWRRLQENSGGPGVFRGGQGIEQAFYIDYTDELAGFAKTISAHVPSKGFGGGMPGSASTVVPLPAANAHELMASGVHIRERTLASQEQPIRNKQVPYVAHRGDIVRFLPGGGGGLGDPLLRDPGLVARDVRDGYITLAHATAAYGVVLDAAGGVDEEATRRRQHQIRRDRIGGEPREPLLLRDAAGISLVIEDEKWACGYCGHPLAPVAENWRDGAVVREVDAVARFRDLGMRVRDRSESPPIVVREHYCPSCAGALGVDVTLAGRRPSPAARLHAVPAAAER
jgi:N-methylhydantoinase B